MSRSSHPPDDDSAVSTLPAGPAVKERTQEIRLAVVLNGGVSLAVWISGVTFELYRLVQASRVPDGQSRADDPYAQLLDLLDATARIDVIAGTSAGGLNGGFLALGLVHGIDLSLLRGVWEQQGDLSQLLRDPRRKDAPSLLRGDYFHEKLAEAYEGAFHKESRGRQAPEKDTVDLYLTGTLWNGRRTQFADDMGRRIVETDYDATFHFTSDPEIVGRVPDQAVSGDLRKSDVAAQLAVASRCTSSFPAAFEPFWVKVDAEQRTDERWQSSAGRVNFSSSQFVIDGGVLRNKPIRPAIDAVYRQSAAHQVRRILAYVVPDPGERAAATASTPGVTTTPENDVPGAHDVVLGAMTRLRATDSVADELAEIRRRNQDTRHRRRTRDRLAGTLLAAGSSEGLVASAFPGYLEVRRESAAQSIAGFILSAPRNTRWSRAEIATVLRDLFASDRTMPFIPDSEGEPDKTLKTALDAAGPAWNWGQTTVNRLGDLVLDVLKRAVWLAGPRSPVYGSIVQQRSAAHTILDQVRAERAGLNAYWRGVALPRRGEGVAASPEEITQLATGLATAARQWTGRTDAQEDLPSRLRGQSLAFAACLWNGKAALESVVSDSAPKWDLHGGDHVRLVPLVRALLGDAHGPEDVLRNMLQLEVLHLAFAGASADIEQEVELVQVSSTTPELITGIQLHHFGAFYRRSWRTNDWLRGRLAGCQQLVEMLLAPERLRQLGFDAAGTLGMIHDIAVGPVGTPNRAEFEASWSAAEAEIVKELGVLSGDEPLPRTFPHCAAQIAHRLTVGMLEKELGALADSVDAESPDALPESREWAVGARATLAPRGGPTSKPTAEVLAALLGTSERIGRQRIQNEQLTGSDTYAKTVAHAVGAASSTATTFKKPKQVAAVLSAFRGYTILLWLMVNFLANKSNTGRNAVAVTLGVGGTLVALTLVLPAVPVGVTLAGVLLLLAATTTAALRRKPLLGSSKPVLRLLGALVIVVLALAGVVVEQVRSSEKSAWDVVVGLLLRVLVVALIVGFGWFIAWERRPAGPGRKQEAGDTATSGTGATSATLPGSRPQRPPGGGSSPGAPATVLPRVSAEQSQDAGRVSAGRRGAQPPPPRDVDHGPTAQ